MKAKLLTRFLIILLLFSSQTLLAAAPPPRESPPPASHDGDDGSIGSLVIYVYDGIVRLFDQVKTFPIRCHNDNYRIWFRVADGVAGNLIATHYLYVDLTPAELHEFFGYPEEGCGGPDQGYLVKAWTNSVTNMLMSRGILKIHEGHFILNPESVGKYQTCEGWRTCE